MENAQQVAEQKLARAKSALIHDHPFLATTLMGCETVWQAGLGTAATDGKRILYDPEFVSSLTQEQVVFLAAHEAAHIQGGHHLRRGERDTLGWNIATDYIINQALREAGFDLIAGALYDPRFDGLSGEEAYRILESELPKPEPKPEPESGDEGDEGDEGEAESEGEGEGNEGEADGSPGNGGQEGSAADPTQSKPGGSEGAAKDEGPGAPSHPPSPFANHPGANAFGGKVEDLKNDDGSELTPEQKDEALVDHQIDLHEQAMVEKAMGSPGDTKGWAQRRAEESTRQVADPREVLPALMQSRCDKSDYTWKRPNPRYMQGGCYLPSLAGESLGEIVVAFDTSGSITDANVADFRQMVERILTDWPGTAVHVVYCDTEVRGEELVTSADLPLTLKPVGGGGTRFSPVFSWVRDEDVQPTLLIYMTDMECSYMPQEDPGYPVFWLATEGVQALRYYRHPGFGTIVDLVTGVVVERSTKKYDEWGREIR